MLNCSCSPRSGKQPGKRLPRTVPTSGSFAPGPTVAVTPDGSRLHGPPGHDEEKGRHGHHRSVGNLSDADRDYLKQQKVWGGDASSASPKEPHPSGTLGSVPYHRNTAVTSPSSIFRAGKSLRPISQAKEVVVTGVGTDPDKALPERLQPGNRANCRAAGRCGNGGQERPAYP